MIALRWSITVAYAVFSAIGVIDISLAGFAVSFAALVTTNALFTFFPRARVAGVPIVLPIRYADAAVLTAVIVALHDVRSPVFGIYFVIVTAIAHQVTQRHVAAYAIWIVLNYVAGAAIISAQGYEVSQSYVALVVAVISVMGMMATVLAAGEERARRIIATVAVTDSLTGLPNRRYFHQAYPQSLAQALAERVPLGLMLIDVDYFKEINDREGHAAGDDRLRTVVRALEDRLRRGDLLARYGGDEFIVVAPQTSRGDALQLAERLREGAAAAGASVSIGLAIYPDDADSQDRLIEAADRALYRAKKAGRNCVRDAA
jgi:diguanylate cyclase (GGDEF)-like protein